MRAMRLTRFLKGVHPVTPRATTSAHAVRRAIQHALSMLGLGLAGIAATDDRLDTREI